MENSYFSTISSVPFLASAIRRINKGNNLGSLVDDEGKLASASNWRREHLLACWVVVKETGSSILPILQDYTAGSDVEVLPPFIPIFLEGPPASAGRLCEVPEHRYVRLCEPSSLGSLWAALGEFHRLYPVEDGDDSDNDSDVSFGPPSFIFRFPGPRWS